jgi:type II secretory pathway pseudopilin PulG
MITLVIVGILVIVGVPSYQRYVINAKMAEAYSIMGALGEHEISYFLDNNEFAFLQTNPENLVKPMLITDDREWEIVGNPIAIGTPTFFSYSGLAGKVDDSGTEYDTSPLNGRTFFLLSNGGMFNLKPVDGGPPGGCNSGITSSTLGLSVTPNYDFVILGAVANFNENSDPLCTVVVRVLEASPSNGRKPTFRGGFITVNQGE